MLERIYEQSSQIVDMFMTLEKNIISERQGKDKDTIAKEGYAEIPKDAKPEPHLDSRTWNNDIDRYTMNTIDDLDLEPDQLSLIRKAWEIGTQKIVLQTVIEIDGDVTTYISKNFKDNFDNKVMKIHNDSITISTSFWSSLVKTISEMVGETFKTIIGK
jgi:hypothetical protein